LALRGGPSGDSDRRSIFVEQGLEPIGGDHFETGVVLAEDHQLGHGAADQRQWRSGPAHRLHDMPSIFHVRARCAGCSILIGHNAGK
jgi:hypothetical protein